jgi:hypothetical protein
MRWLLGLLGSVVAASTASAQPGANDAPPTEAPAGAPSSAPPASAPSNAAPPIEAPAPGGPPGLTAPCSSQRVPGPGCAVPSLPAGAYRVMQPTLVIQSEPEIDYRWQIFLADSASLAFALSGSEKGVTVGALGYLLAAPIVHLAHDEGGRAGLSLALRLGLPIVAASAGAALTKHACADPDDCDDDGSLEGAILGFGLGMLTAMVVDTVLIARPVKTHKTTTTWVPQVTATSQHVGLGVVGRF